MRLQQGEGRPVLCLDSEETRTEGVLGTDSCATNPQKIKIEQSTWMGCLWFAAWLFTIGYLHLSFWRGVLALVIWPYYIGLHASALIR